MVTGENWGTCYGLHPLQEEFKYKECRLLSLLCLSFSYSSLMYDILEDILQQSASLSHNIAFGKNRFLNSSLPCLFNFAV